MGQKDFREDFTNWLTKKYGANSGTISSYIKAIDILSQILSKELFKTIDINILKHFITILLRNKEIQTVNTIIKMHLHMAVTGFYSASIKSYLEFLKAHQNTSKQSAAHMNFPLNTILYGPPGTGKTYNTVLRSAEIIENREIDSYGDALQIFKANLHDRIEFITFHQNYVFKHEDFIQGLRPDTKDDNDQFKFKKGLTEFFKVIADRALENIKESEKDPRKR